MSIWDCWKYDPSTYLGLGKCINKRTNKEGAIVDIASSPKFGTRICVLNNTTKRKEWMHCDKFHRCWTQVFDRVDPCKQRTK